MKLSESMRGKTGVLLVIFGIFGMVLILLGGGVFKSESGEKIAEKRRITDYTGYTGVLEEKVAELVERVVGERPAVLLTLECSEEAVYAENTRSENSYSADGRLNSDRSEREYLIFQADGAEGGLLLREICPRIRGIAVVCRGGDSSALKLEISELLSVAFGISKSKVSVSGTPDG